MGNITKEEKKMLIELVSNEQIHMIIKDPNKYKSKKYTALEALKVKIKDMVDEDGFTKYDDEKDILTRKIMPQ